jgi:type III restriction enzyme
MSFEVTEPILCSPYIEPDRHWFIPEGASPVTREGRRKSFVFQPQEGELTWNLADGTLEPMTEYGSAYELVLVNRIRAAVARWRESGYQNATGTTRDLLAWWRRDGRETPLFYAQLEAAETVIFLTEGPYHELQGIEIPRDEPTTEQRAAGAAAFTRYGCKMATGTGKTTVMGMITAWSILNKVVNRSDARFSDLVLAVCPNVTIRDRLQELDVERGDASIYRTRDLVPASLMPRLAQGRVIVTNWHLFEPRTQGVGDARGRVLKAGRPVTRIERVYIGDKNTTARGDRYLTETEYLRLVASTELEELEPPADREGRTSALVRWTRYVESDTSIVQRILGRSRGKQNILVLNDEAHHAYRIHRDDDDHDDDAFGDDDLEDEFVREATIWIDGLDRIHRLRGINRCIDLSATPFFLGAAGRETGRPFQWTVSDFGLVDAIESGLVKIPQLAVRDDTGGERPKYHNLWKWVMGNLTPAERGGRRANPKPEAVLKWAHIPMATIAGDWERTRQEWTASDETRPPVLIIVCKDTKLAKVVHEWIAEGWSSYDVPVLGMASLRNADGATNTIRVDSKVVAETDAGAGEGGGSKADDARWMRFTLDTVGMRRWPRDSQERDIFPAEFEELARRRAERMEVPAESLLHPPGRDVRCIVSVGMLTEGWDARTVTHVVGLRPFQSQLLCEQVVGRALRRASYDPVQTPDGPRFGEEIAQVLGVPFEIIPFKSSGGPPKAPTSRRHVRALPERAEYAISFPRVEGYTQVVRNRIDVDWAHVPAITLDPTKIPSEVKMAAALPNNQGRVKAIDFGKAREMTLETFFATKRLQQLVFEASGTLTRDFIATGAAKAPAHVLFPQLQRIIARYVAEKVNDEGNDKRVLFCAPYYGWFLERLVQAIRSDASVAELAEAPRLEKGRPEGSSADVDFWTSRPVADTIRSHVNYMVSDSGLEAKAAAKLDGTSSVRAWVKNTGLGLAVPYAHNGERHDYLPDFVVRLGGPGERYLLLETKGHDELVEVKQSAAERWCSAVTADGRWGNWTYRVAWSVGDVAAHLLELAPEATEESQPLQR